MAVKSILLGATLVVALATGSIAAAQSQPLPPGPGPFTGRPLPTQPSQPITPRINDEQLRPLPSQTELRVESFTTRDLRCSADLSSASYNVSARLPIQTDPVRGNQADIEILVDGVSAGSMTLTARDGYVTFSRRVNVTGGASADHQIVFVLNGAVRSAPISAPHSCATLRPSVTEHQPGVATRPNLAFSAPVYVAVRRIDNRIGVAGRPTPPRITYSFNAPLVLELPRDRSNVIQFRGVRLCDAGDTYAPQMEFAVAIDAFMVDDPAAHFSASGTGTRGLSPGRYVDTRGGSLWATGDALGTPNIEGTPLPAGHQWMVFSGQLHCTSSGNLDLRFDPGDLRESSTEDNALRLRFVTRP